MEGETFDYTKAQLESWDFVVLFLYFASILCVGIWSSRRSRRNSENNENAQNSDQVGGYFLASRNMHFIPVGASLFASNIGSEHFIGLAGSAASDGFAIACYELNAIFVLMLLGWLFIPVYHASGVYTMPEYMRKRFGAQRIRVLLSILSLLIYVLTKISADLYAGALFIKYAMGFAGDEEKGESGFYLSILVLLAIAGFFCIAGGLSAVIWTDFVQTILMVIGVLVLMALTFAKVGGYEKILDGYSTAVPDPEFAAFTIKDGVNTTCSSVRSDFAHLFHSIDDDFLPWTGVLSGMIVGSIYYWCTDQVITQRLLAAKNISHAKGGTVLAAFLKLLPFFTLVLPGMAARILFTNEVACSNPEACKKICESTKGCSNVAFVFLVLKVSPIVLRGLMLAVMLAALMSSLTSIFNSASTVFTMDVYKLLRPKASPLEMVFVGRSFVVLLLAISIVWIPIIQEFHNAQLFVYVQVISAFFQPPIAAVFVLAMLWHRVTEPGVFWAMIAGFIVGLIRFALEFSFSAPDCGSLELDTRPDWVITWVSNFHYLHFGTFLFFFTMIVAALISYLTEPIPESKLVRLTYWTRFSALPRDECSQEARATEVNESNGSAFFSSQNFTGMKKVLFTLCGVSQKDLESQDKRIESRQLSAEDEAVELSRFLREDGKLKRYLNIGAIVVMTSAAFVFGFFA